MNDDAKHSADPGDTPPAPAATAARMVCQLCLEPIDTEDRFCRFCGGITKFGEAMVKIGKLAAPASLEAPSRPPSWMESPILIVPLLLFILGPFAFPMLWRSRRFSRGWKIALTLIVTVITVAPTLYLGTMIKGYFEQIQNVLKGP